MPQNHLFPKSEAIDLSDEDDFSLDLFFKPLVFYVYFVEKLRNDQFGHYSSTKARMQYFFEAYFPDPHSPSLGGVRWY